ncbi:hypothetical protein ABXS71_16960 [Bacillus infantis]|uniref:hypothetical protein n=1 Tax=Bacillus infantis TaxID=324767 RepID=UPI00344FEF3F
MGILYDKVKLSQESLKQGMIQELYALGVTESRDGRNIDELDYYALRHELAINQLMRG